MSSLPFHYLGYRISTALACEISNLQKQYYTIFDTYDIISIQLDVGIYISAKIRRACFYCAVNSYNSGIVS